MKYIFLLATVILLNQQANAQGCVAVRQMGGVSTVCTSGDQSNNYFIKKGDVQLGLNYRYFHSWRHFVGTEEQPHRQNTGGGIGLDGKDRGNAVNIYSHAVDF